MPGDATNPRDASAGDLPAPQVLDAAGDVGPADKPVGQDAAVDAAQGDRAVVGDSGTAACIPSFLLDMPRTLAEVQETYGVCQFPTGSALSDTTWVDGVWGGTVSLMEAHTCVEAGDPQKGMALGVPFKFVLGPDPLYSRASGIPLRIYAIHEDHGAVRVRAAYDLISLAPDVRALPPYPEHYLRLDLVCGDPDAIPRLKGWTGRIGWSENWVLSGQDFLLLEQYVLWGSAAGETGERALRFVLNLP